MSTNTTDLDASALDQSSIKIKREQLNSVSPTKNTSTYELSVVWAFIHVPLVWGIYEAAQFVALLLKVFPHQG
jgi:hypothetical protein